MNPNDFRRNAHTFVDWMADYYEGVEAYPVRSPVAPGDIAARLPTSPPLDAEPIDRIFADFKTHLLPGITHWQHPSFFAYFPANASPPSVLAEMLTASLGVQGMIWQTSPAATELETRVMDWLRQMIGLPEGFDGVIQDSASSATLCALLSARERATGWRVNDEGATAATGLRVYCSEEAHSSVEKDVKIAGMGRRNLCKIPVDGRFAMRPDALEQAITQDLAHGATPACVVATLGTTGASGIDPLRPIGEICRRHGVWLHVDAAWAGSALILPEYRWLIDGIEDVDSFVFNPHKWLFTNFDCSAYFVRDADALTRTFAILPEYLKSREDADVTNYRDWGIPLGRRFRALKLWFVIRAYGLDGLRRRIAAHIDWAHTLARQIDEADGFELLVPPTLALLCFRFHPADVHEPAVLDRLNQQLLDRLNDSGALYLTHTRLNGAYAIRFCIGQTHTQQCHVDTAWQRIRETAAALPVPSQRQTPE